MTMFIYPMPLLTLGKTKNRVPGCWSSVQEPEALCSWQTAEGLAASHTRWAPCLGLQQHILVYHLRDTTCVPSGIRRTPDALGVKQVDTLSPGAAPEPQA